MKTYKHQLDTSSKKFYCPECDKKRFVRYVETATGRYLKQEYGRCDREVHCGHHCKPGNKLVSKPKIDKPKKEPAFVPVELMAKSKAGYQANYFVKWLHTILPKQMVNDLIETYHISTSKQLPGGTIFWQIDTDFNIHRGKIIVYGRNGHKKRFGSVHKQLGIPKEEYPPVCWFGSHLLTGNSKPVAIVESEKTAIIASAYFPGFVWLATTSLSLMKPNYANELIGRNVVLFPDLGASEKWKQKAESLQYFCNIQMADFLERMVPDEDTEKGYDLADYLIQFNIEEFRANEGNLYHYGDKDRPNMEKYEGEISATIKENTFQKGYPLSWDITPPELGTPEYYECIREELRT